jgi:hypothetical protein
VKKTLLCLLALFVSAVCTDAQIYKVSFKDEKAAKKYKKHTVEIDGRMVVLGEAVPGGGISFKDNTINYRGPQGMRGDSTNTLWVLNPKDPTIVPYVIKDGEKVTKKAKMLLRIDGNYIDKVSFFMRNEDLMSLSREYRYRLDRIEGREDKRDEMEEGSVPWFSHHQVLVTEYERLVSWLESIGFEPAAKKVRKDLEKQTKVVAKQGLKKRITKALESVETIDTPAELIEASQKVTGGTAKFKVQQSQHIRIVYLEEVGDQRVENLLKLGEQIIDGFRIEFVDPFLAEDFPDNIPDTRFQEFFFGPEERDHYRDFFVEYYGQAWDQKRIDKFLDSSGTNAHPRMGPPYLSYNKLTENRDLEGTVSHRLGHTLAEYHYNGGYFGWDQPWIGEGLAYYISFEYFGRNTLTCFEWRDPAYAKPDIEEGEQTVQQGMRDAFNRMALDEGPRLDKITLKYLVDFEDPDLAKSWSFIDYVCKDMGEDGQRWLRACGEYARDKKTFHKKWRVFTEKLFDVTGKDVFRMIDEQWREYASSQQDVSEDGRGK